MDQENKQVSAVHERDLVKLLERFGIKEKFENNQLKCKFCGDTVNADNIYSVFPESGTVNLICDKPQCITSFLGYLDEKKKTKLEQ